MGSGVGDGDEEAGPLLGMERALGSDSRAEDGEGALGPAEKGTATAKAGWYRQSKMWFLILGSSLVAMLFNYVDELTPIMVKTLNL